MRVLCSLLDIFISRQGKGIKRHTQIVVVCITTYLLYQLFSLGSEYSLSTVTRKSELAVITLTPFSKGLWH